MVMRKRYRRRAGQTVAAVQLRLDTDGLRYRKWGHDQLAKPGDWLVDNGGDVYTVDAEIFEQTYRPYHPDIAPGAYEKVAPVWAEPATAAGSVATNEGHTDYVSGDWLVSNHEDGSDAYAVSSEKFESLYEPDE